MPQPAANDRIAQDLIRVYEQAQAALVAELDSIAGDPNRFRQRRRLRELIRLHDATMAELRDTTRTWWSTQLPVVHAAGASDFAKALGARWSRLPAHDAAVEQFTRRTWTDVARRLEDIDRDTRMALRQLARASTRSALLESRTAVAAGRDMAREAAKAGLWSVRYHGGARHTMRDYADTVIRTTTATAYNDGAITQARVEGIEHIQYADGPGCGIYSHNDGTEANGMIVRLEEVVPLAHPRCRRALLPAPFARAMPGADLSVGPERVPGPEPVPRREPRTPRTPRQPRASRGDNGTPPIDPAAIVEARRLLTAARAAVDPIQTDLERAITDLGRLEGLSHRLKTVESFARKISDYAALHGLTSEESAAGVNDVIRFTAILADNSYTSGYNALVAQLRAAGHIPRSPRNYWTSNGYKGLNLNLVAPDGTIWELQVHTLASWETNEATHALYERFRRLPPSSPEADRLWAAIEAEFARVSMPPDADTIQG